jgi:hypothetical protein
MISERENLVHQQIAVLIACVGPREATLAENQCKHGDIVAYEL